MLRVAAKNLSFDFTPVSTCNYRFGKNPTGAARQNRFDVTQEWVAGLFGENSDLRRTFLADPDFDAAVMISDRDTSKDTCLRFMVGGRRFKVVDGQDGNAVCEERDVGVTALSARAQEEIDSMAAAPGRELALIVAPDYKSREDFRPAMELASETIAEILRSQPAVSDIAKQTLSGEPIPA